MKKYRFGLIGCGKMGGSWLKVLTEQAADRWEVASICEIDPARQAFARELAPGARIVTDENEIYQDPSIDVVGLFTLADLRAAQIRRALAANKHIIAEKPIADTVAQEEKLLEEIEASDRIVAVNLFNRNGWYHHEAQAFIDRGEIGKLAVIRICHMTPGTLPGESYKAEGPPFHNCGMHYIDVARWYAKSEYNTWHAQGVRMWGIDDPWWVTAHGTFENGVVFEVTNGFVYGHLAKDYIVSCWLECIGTLGVARYRHNFVDVELQLNGVNETIEKTGPYGGKKQDVMLAKFAASLDAGHDIGLPSARDSVIASRISQQMQDAAKAGNPPVIGEESELDQIRQVRQTAAAAQ